MRPSEHSSKENGFLDFIVKNINERMIAMELCWFSGSAGPKTEQNSRRSSLSSLFVDLDPGLVQSTSQRSF